MHPRVIAFEGPDAAGKTTQLQHAKQVLEALGQKVEIIRSPGGAHIAEIIRREVLPNPMPNRIRIQAMLLAFVSSSIEKIAPAIRDGYWILLDRWALSTIIYQGLVPGHDAAGVSHLVETTLGNQVCPGSYIVYQVAYEVAKARLEARTDKKPNSFEDPETMRRSCMAYEFSRSFVRQAPVFYVDGNGTELEVAEATKKILEQLVANDKAVDYQELT